MSQPASQHPPGPAARYAEDHCALRWPFVLHGIAWPALSVFFVVLAIATRNTSLLLPLLITLWAAGAAGSLIFVPNLPTGIRIDAGGVRIGGIRRAERHRARGHQHAGRRKLPPATAQRAQVFSCPWNGVRRIDVVTDRAELRDLAREGRDIGLRPSKVAGLGRLWAPYMNAALVISVDLDAASLPEFRPPDSRRPWFRMPHFTQYSASPVWFAPTRHPDTLRAALAEFNVPGAARRA